MIGHLQIQKRIELISNVIVVVGKCPSWFDGQIIDDVPMIYTERSRPKPNDLRFLTGKMVQVIHGEEATDELFSKWLVEIINSKPLKTIAVDSEGEIFLC